MDGAISQGRFNTEIEMFLEISKANNDTWHMSNIEADPTAKFLVKKRTFSSGSHTASQAVSLEEAVTEETADLSEDSATLSSSVSGMSGSRDMEVSTWEYHVVFSPSYGVPVLYFNAYRQDGRLFDLEDVWTSVSPYHQERLEHERWSFITQQEHPLLQRPFFQLHPCHTANLMKQVLGDNDMNRSYIVTWLSTVGPVVHLDVPLCYAKSYKQAIT